MKLLLAENRKFRCIPTDIIAIQPQLVSSGRGSGTEQYWTCVTRVFWLRGGVAHGRARIPNQFVQMRTYEHQMSPPYQEPISRLHLAEMLISTLRRAYGGRIYVETPRHAVTNTSSYLSQQFVLSRASSSLPDIPGKQHFRPLHRRGNGIELLYKRREHLSPRRLLPLLWHVQQFGHSFRNSRGTSCIMLKSDKSDVDGCTRRQRVSSRQTRLQLINCSFLYQSRPVDRLKSSMRCLFVR